MAVESKFPSDVEVILSHRHDLGADYWTTPDKRLMKGSPFSAYNSALMLLEHWVIRKPIGPCHYGIGTLFMQVSYPFGDYNLFWYVYVLSFCNRAKKDERFLDALAALQAKLVDGNIVVERVVPKLAKMEFCKKGQPSELATKRYTKILNNLRGS